MPIDYSKYPKNWKTEIRPAILERANNCCEFCKVKNRNYVFRGFLENGLEVYQDVYANIYNAKTGEILYKENFDIYVKPLSGNENQQAIKIVLTIAHLDHNIENNDYSNLKALCQKCHLNLDKEHHRKNAKKTLNKKKGLQEMF